MPENSTQGTTETLVGIAAVIAGFGVILLALFPLALPILVLTGVALLPLLALAIPVLVLVAAWLALKGFARLADRITRRRSPDPERAQAAGAAASRASRLGVSSVNSAKKPPTASTRWSIDSAANRTDW